jgi:isopentenyl diphosphate isomerase/L-lactate dehydrogenase-like FMN-dependent dehydrogenase
MADVKRPAARDSRRRAIRNLATFMAASPLMTLVDANGEPVEATEPLGGAQPGRQGGPPNRPPADRPDVIRPPAYRDEIMKVINLHEFEDAAKKTLSVAAYDYVAAGAGDELTLKANREAFSHYWVRRKIMVDVSKIDTSFELFGTKYEHPILLGPGGAKNIVIADGEKLSAQAARQTKTIMVGGQAPMLAEMGKAGQAPVWWGATLGEGTQAQAVEFAKRAEDNGASALCLTVDYPYTSARDRPSRDQWDPEWARTHVYGTSEFRVGFQAGMLDPYTPNLTWEWMKWVKPQTKLPIVIKGILTAEDARLAVENGVQAIIVSNHGARTLDGMGGTLDALPEVVEAVNGRVPVLVDGGIRRGGDVIKALALGAKAVLIGRPFLWGLAAFGQDGVQRVVELLHGELRIALGLVGAGNLKAIDRSFIRPAWKAYKPGINSGSASR